MRYALVRGGVVVEAWNRDPFKLFDPLYAAQFQSCPAEVQVGWLRNSDGTFSAPTPITPFVSRVRTCKLIARLAELGVDEQVETAYVNAAPPPQRRLAQVQWGRVEFMERTNPLLIAALTARGFTSAQIDDLFCTADALPDSA